MQTRAWPVPEVRALRAHVGKEQGGSGRSMSQEFRDETREPACPPLWPQPGPKAQSTRVSKRQASYPETPNSPTKEATQETLA